MTLFETDFVESNWSEDCKKETSALFLKALYYRILCIVVISGAVFFQTHVKERDRLDVVACVVTAVAAVVVVVAVAVTRAAVANLKSTN